jgi:hypothetical protein
MTDPGTLVQILLTNILPRIPSLLVILTGFVLVFVYWRRNKKVSLLVLAAMTIALIGMISGTIQGIAMPFMMNRRGMSLERYGLITSCWGIAWAVLGAVELGLLLAAAFSDRERNDEAGPIDT